MGDKLNTSNELIDVSLPPWLDIATAALTADIVRTLAAHRPDALAVILYGSIARHDERAITDAHPSDVDVLVIFDTDDEDIAIRDGKELFSVLGIAYNRHLDTLRDVKVMFASRSLSEWDPMFIANIARDGVLLWARGSLSPALMAVAHRTFASSDTSSGDRRASIE